MNHVQIIIKRLDRVTACGLRPSEIFEDWLDVVHAALEALPAHLTALAREGTFAADSPETQALFARLRSRYPQKYAWREFTAAFHVLLQSVETWDDIIGQVYMQWGSPNKHNGQFFTPYGIAKLMASLNDVEGQVYARLEEAYKKSSCGALHLLLTGPERVSAFVRRMGGELLPVCAEYFQPISVSDPCCGSGVMFLAIAEQTPRWALDWNLVQFFGQDIDSTCVKMAQTNIMLYGLNGYRFKCAFAFRAPQASNRRQPALIEA